MSNSYRRDYALGKTKGTGKLGSFCQGFEENDCKKAKSACQWIIKEKRKPYCQRSIKTHSNMNALSKFNTNKKSKLSANIVIAFSMYHKNGDKMTTEENVDLIAGEAFPTSVAEYILQEFGESEDGYSIRQIQTHSSAVHNFIIVQIPIAVNVSRRDDVNDIIEDLQEKLESFVRKGPFEIDDDVFINSMNVVQMDY
jgi:hypothetical protein